MSRRRRRAASQPSPAHGWLQKNAGNIAAGVALVGVGVAITAAGNPLHGGAAVVKGLSVVGLGSLKGGVLVAAGTPVVAKAAADHVAGNGR